MIRLNHIFDTQPDIADTEEMVSSIREIRGAIRFDNVSFRYGEEGPWVLRDVSFHVPAGSIAGRSWGARGPVKTTLVEMIPRLLEATQGTVRIDDRRIRQISAGCRSFVDRLCAPGRIPFQRHGGQLTSPSGRRRTKNVSNKLPERRCYWRMCAISRKDSKHSWGNGESRFPAGRNSGLPLRGRSFAGPLS